MYMKKKDSNNRTHVTKKEVEEDPDTEQIPHPLSRLKTEPHYNHQLEDDGALAEEDMRRMETERNLVEATDDVKSKVRNNEEQAGLDLGF